MTAETDLPPPPWRTPRPARRSRPMSEVKLLPISWAEFWMRQGHVEAAHNHHAFEMAQQWLHAHLAEREREVEALRELASQLQYADKHAQVTKDVAGEFICLPPWLWIEIRDKARAALGQESNDA